MGNFVFPQLEVMGFIGPHRREGVVWGRIVHAAGLRGVLEGQERAPSCWGYFVGNPLWPECSPGPVLSRQRNCATALRTPRDGSCGAMAAHHPCWGGG